MSRQDGWQTRPLPSALTCLRLEKCSRYSAVDAAETRTQLRSTCNFDKVHSTAVRVTLLMPPSGAEIDTVVHSDLVSSLSDVSSQARAQSTKHVCLRLRHHRRYIDLSLSSSDFISHPSALSNSSTSYLARIHHYSRTRTVTCIVHKRRAPRYSDVSIPGLFPPMLLHPSTASH
jgi:hypothetical protein